MKKAIFIVTIILLILITAVAVSAKQTALPETIRASAFKYDASMPAIHSGRFIYDPKAAELRASAFQN